MASIHCEGLLVDMDGVLVDSTPAVARMWARWAARHGMDPDHVFRLGNGRPSLSSVRELLPDAPEAEQLAEARRIEREEIEDIADVKALPGAEALLAAAPAARLAIVTSATRELAHARLGAAGLWGKVVNIVTVEDIRRGKPDPEPYLKGAAALGLKPGGCVVLEDAVSGTRSGKAAGARVLALRTTTPEAALRQAGADWTINDCSSLRCSAVPGGGLEIEVGRTETFLKD